MERKGLPAPCATCPNNLDRVDRNINPGEAIVAFNLRDAGITYSALGSYPVDGSLPSASGRLSQEEVATNLPELYEAVRICTGPEFRYIDRTDLVARVAAKIGLKLQDDSQMCFALKMEIGQPRNAEAVSYYFESQQASNKG